MRALTRVLFAVASLTAWFSYPQTVSGSSTQFDPAVWCSETLVLADDDSERLRSVCQMVLGGFESDLPIHVVNAEFSSVLKAETEKVRKQKSAKTLAADYCDASRRVKFGISAESLAALVEKIAKLPSINRPTTLSLQGLLLFGDFSLINKDLPFGLTFENAIFCGHVNLYGTSVPRSVILRTVLVLSGPNAKVEGVINANGTSVGADLIVEDSHIGAVLASRSTVRGRLSLAGTRFGYADFSGTSALALAVPKSVQSNDVVQRVKDNVPELAQKMRPIKEFFLSGFIHLVDAKIEGEFYGDDLVTDGPVSSQFASYRNVRLKGAKLRALDFRHVTVQLDVDLARSTIGGESELDERGCFFERSDSVKSLDFVSFRNARIGGNLLITAGSERNNTKIVPASSKKLICINQTHVGGNLDLTGFEGDRVDLRHSQIGNALVLAADTGLVYRSNPKTGSLNLANARMEAFHVASNVVLPENTIVSGAQIGSVYVSILDRGSLRGAKGAEAENTVVALLATIPFENIGRGGYRVFRDAFRKVAQEDAANTVSLAEEKRVTTDDSKGWRWLTRKMSYVLGGYGLRPDFTFRIALIAITIGAVVFRYSSEGRIFLFAQSNPQASLGIYRTAKFTTFWSWFDAVIFSVDRLIPIVTINKKHGDLQFLSSAPVRAYFVFHNVLGWLLGATVFLVISESLGFK